jgi:replicative DNA helicase
VNNDNQLRIPPFSVEAEQSVLGGLLSDPEAIDRIPFLEGAHFYRWEHRLIFEEIHRQHTAARTPDAVTVAERIGDGIENCMQYLVKLRNSEPSGARIRSHADIVVEKAKRRALIVMSDELAAAAFGIQQPAEIADFFVGRMESLVRQKTMQEPERMSSLMHSYVELLEKRRTGEIRPIATGLEALDSILGGGIDRGTLTIIAGRPSSGKSALAIGISGSMAQAGQVAAFLSMEMPKHQVVDRRVATMGGIPLSWLKNPDVDQVQWEAVSNAIRMTEAQEFYIDDQTALNMMAIRAKARKLKRSLGRLDALWIDQLSFITGSRLERRHEQISEYTRGLLALAKELDCAIGLLCQLSRKCEERPNKRPQLSDLAESGAIEQDANTIIFTYRDEIYDPASPDAGTAELIVGKQRQGKTGTARVAYIGEQTRFANLAKNYQHPVPRPIPAPARGFD